jgi:hypothetical protein
VLAASTRALSLVTGQRKNVMMIIIIVINDDENTGNTYIALPFVGRK